MARTPRPKAGARALNCGWISCCVAASTALQLCPMRQPITVFVTHDDLPSEVCRAPQNRAEEQAPDNPPDDPDVHFGADTQARWVRNSPKRRPGHKMKFNGFPRHGPHGHLRTGPGALRRQANRAALRGHHRGREIMRTAARHRLLSAWENAGAG
ncbi:MAG: hypothetical protein GDA36_09735 [Rhodobacteraceae bacterium]|nr:hypothetical protein [Paracoccaceae bacterium]